jgi:hypothetical protein
MKKLIIAILILAELKTAAQTAAQKFESGIKQIATEYLSDFKNITGAQKEITKNGYLVFYSKYKLFGTIDSSCLVICNAEKTEFSFEADLNTDIINSGEANQILLKTVFSFGKVKGIASGVEWVIDFIPANEKNAPGKVKKLCVSIFDGNKKPDSENTTVTISVQAKE